MHVREDFVDELQAAVHVDVAQHLVLGRGLVGDGVAAGGHAADVLDRGLKALQVVCAHSYLPVVPEFSESGAVVLGIVVLSAEAVIE